MPLMLHSQTDTRDYVDLDRSSDVAKQLEHAYVLATEEKREMRPCSTIKTAYDSSSRKMVFCARMSWRRQSSLRALFARTTELLAGNEHKKLTPLIRASACA